jgi:hypothetical protein
MSAFYGKYSVLDTGDVVKAIEGYSNEENKPCNLIRGRGYQADSL